MDATFASMQAQADAAYDAAIAEGRSAFDAYLNTMTALKAGLKDGDICLCPVCGKELAPIDALCVYCEIQDRDAQADRQAQAKARHDT